MPNKMLIDASHPEETRVVVTRGNRIEEFDFESQDKKQLKGNIYLARVTRVEPSLQAAFVEYGGNRHGFLAFNEIHPDYYQIPVADRQALLRAEAEAAEHEDDEDDEDERRSRRKRRGGKGRGRDGEKREHTASSDASGSDHEDENGTAEDGERDARPSDDTSGDEPETIAAAVDVDTISEPYESGDDEGGEKGERKPQRQRGDLKAAPTESAGSGDGTVEEVGHASSEESEVESVGAEDALEELPSRRRVVRKQYKIQEVIKRRQILLVQVVKEERGNKGAALTTYLSLAGRYSVLMPNTARGGGISRKITSAQDRKRLKDVVKDLDVPQGMGVILRTAGANRTKAEIKRDYEYLMRLWETVRTLTLQSTAPALVYEEGSLIKRSVRDLYNKDIEEILVAGDDGYREAKDFMRMLMPSHAKVVQPYRDMVPIFARNGIEAQLDRMLQPQVTLKSGGYIIINQTEALVSIDVNSGRSTKEHSIEDTALQTNLEAAEEVARQLRLRDLAGLIVIDFIDMEEKRNNRAVEKRLKDHLKNDRARIQVGRISHFGLLEMSRQRIRASVLESTMQVCPHCGGTGHVRSDSSLALHVVRGIEEHLLKDARAHISVRVPTATALYVLNHKRRTLTDLEARFGLTITIEADDHIGAQPFVIQRGAAVEKPVTIPQMSPEFPVMEPEEEETVVEVEAEDEAEEAAEVPRQRERSEQQGERRADGDGEGSRKRRRRRRRRGGRDRDRDQNGQFADNAGSNGASDSDEDGEDEGDEATSVVSQTAESETVAAEAGTPASVEADAETAEADGEAERKKRRRGKRGGKRNREEAGSEADADASPAEAEAVPAEPTDADPVAEAAPAEEPASEPKPKKRAPRRKKADAAAETAAADAVASEPVVAATPAAEVQAPAPAQASETAADTPAPQVEAAEEPKPRASRRRADAEELPATPVEPVVTSSAPAEEAKPKRGWWQRKSFF